jgi:class 3 adenylate cyclase
MQDIAQKIALNDADVEKAERFRRERRTSVLVIMFTDIEGSTALREKLGDLAFERILEEHDSTLLPIIAEHGGAHIKSIGDSIMAVFSEPSSAVQCALKMQERLHGHPWLKVRIGMDMGQVAADEVQGIMKDVFGRFVNRAARVESLANGGHILVTEQIQDSASGWIPKEQISWSCHGEHTVKGVEKPLKIWEPYNSNLTYPIAGVATKATIEQHSAETTQPKSKEHGIRLSFGLGRRSFWIKVAAIVFSVSVLVGVAGWLIISRFISSISIRKGVSIEFQEKERPNGPIKLPSLVSETKVMAEDALVLSYNPKSQEVEFSFILMVANDGSRRDMIVEATATLEALSLPSHPPVPFANPNFRFSELSEPEGAVFNPPFSVEKDSSKKMRCSIVNKLGGMTREVLEHPGELRLSVGLKGERGTTHTLQFCFHLTEKIITETFTSGVNASETFLFPECW